MIGRRTRESTLSTIDRHIRDGHIAASRAALTSHLRRGIARAHRATAANLAWRAGLPHAGVRLLNPLVRPTRLAPARPTAREVAEYAACLVKLGAAEEARDLLEKLDTRDEPRARLYHGLALVGLWDYAAAVPEFETYAGAPGIDTYQALVGRVNLAAALVQVRRDDEAARLLDGLARETAREGHSLLHGNVLQVAGEGRLLAGDPAGARAYLARALAAHGNVGIHAFVVRKLFALAELARTRGTRASRAALDLVRAEARAIRHWESLRDCDRYEARITRDAELLVALYFGTPEGPFRDRLVADFSPHFTPPAAFARAIGPARGGRPATIDVAAGTIDGKPLVAPGGVPHRLLAALARDAYRPANVPSLFGVVFPTECWNPESAPPRIHQAVRFLRRAIAGTGLVVIEIGGRYRLDAAKPLRLALPAGQVFPERGRLRLESLRRSFGDRAFSAGEAARVLDVTRRQATRLLAEAVGRDAAARTGRLAHSRYVLKHEI